MEAGAEHRVQPFGLEPQRVLRLEKMHVIVGQDTNAESNPLEAAMPWIVKLDKEQRLDRPLRDRVVQAARQPATRWSAGRARTASVPDGGHAGGRRRRRPRRPHHQLPLLAAAGQVDRHRLGAGRAVRGGHRRSASPIPAARRSRPPSPTGPSTTPTERGCVREQHRRSLCLPVARGAADGAGAAHADGAQPPRRRRRRSSERDGWRVAAYPADGTPLAWAADVSHVGKIDVRGSRPRIDELTGGLELGRASLRRRRLDAAAVADPRGGACARSSGWPSCARADRRTARDRHDLRLGRRGASAASMVREVFMRSSSLDVRRATGSRPAPAWPAR